MRLSVITVSICSTLMSIQSTCFLLECPFLEATLQIPLLREGAIKGTKFPDDTGKVSSSFIAEYYQSIYEAMYISISISSVLS